jgi:hypothetical protein
MTSKNNESVDLDKINGNFFDSLLNQLSGIAKRAADPRWLEIQSCVRGHPISSLSKAKSFYKNATLTTAQREEIDTEILSIEESLTQFGFDVSNIHKRNPLENRAFARKYFEDGCLCIEHGSLEKQSNAVPDNEAATFYEANCKCSRNYMLTDEQEF